MAAPYIADSYVRAEKILSIIIDEVTQNISSAEKSIATLQAVETALDNLPAVFPQGYLESVQYINTMAANNPDDKAWQALKTRMDKVVTDFQAAKAHYTAVNLAIAGV